MAQHGTLIVTDVGRNYAVIEPVEVVRSVLAREAFGEFNVASGSGTVWVASRRVLHLEPRPQYREVPYFR